MSWVPHCYHASPVCIENEPPVSSRHNCSRSSASCKKMRQCSPKHANPQSLQGVAYQDTPKVSSTTSHAQPSKLLPSPSVQEGFSARYDIREIVAAGLRAFTCGKQPLQRWDRKQTTTQQDRRHSRHTEGGTRQFHDQRGV